MEFSFTTKKIYENLNDVIKDVDYLKSLVDKDLKENKPFIESIEKIKENILLNLKPLKDFVEYNKNKIEAIEFLINGFKIEYESIFNYKKYLDYITDENIKEKIKKLSDEETKHMAALSKIITNFGGIVPINITDNLDIKKGKINLKDIIDSFISAEEAGIEFYEKGLSSFNITELQWTIGNIKIEEENHLKVLKEIKNMIADKNIVIDTTVKGWIDPYMGKPGNRPWIEG
ncbi:MAG TPA: ferritin-like domain-containing protein [Spirochaetota bacterium]|mgnify:CR=1 FL=1|nr:ferritin-like domain-containing protein [Spirochaetota bacterium]HOM38597.1 ferritin-like domain-containing protein [Spirochaetota bacterium]HPQ49734.1 ferritin-like domain-containing protein [Spirochaetota bacterium]